jgi:hypothetical protein
MNELESESQTERSQLVHEVTETWEDTQQRSIAASRGRYEME